MDTDIDLLTKLRVLASIKENQKVCTRQVHVRVDDRSTFQGLFRMWDGESRSHNIESIRSIMQEAIVLMRERPSMQDEVFAATKGIEMLKRTYSSDSHAVARLEVIVDVTRRAVADMRRSGFDGGLTSSIVDKKMV